jgi:hypothetical protein
VGACHIECADIIAVSQKRPGCNPASDQSYHQVHKSFAEIQERSTIGLSHAGNDVEDVCSKLNLHICSLIASFERGDGNSRQFAASKMNLAT